MVFKHLFPISPVVLTSTISHKESYNLCRDWEIVRSHAAQSPSVYECLSIGSPQGKTRGDGLSVGRNQGATDQQRTLLTFCGLQALFSLMFFIPLAVFGFTLSVMHTKALISPGNCGFLKNVYFPQNQQGAKALLFKKKNLELLTTTPNSGNFFDLVKINGSCF